VHDPDVVAFEIRRPWPSGRRLNGRRRWPALVTIWHREPGGHDAGEVCRHYRRWQEPDGTWKSKVTKGWKWHVHHWRPTIHPLIKLRRHLVDRCAWCHGPDRKRDRISISTIWDGYRPHWWASAHGIYHDDCHSAWSARGRCSCEHPEVSGRLSYDTCARCGLGTYARSDLQREADRILIEMVPEGTHPRPEVMALARNLWDVHRAQKETRS
jgi:hypothetical protein